MTCSYAHSSVIGARQQGHRLVWLPHYNLAGASLTKMGNVDLHTKPEKNTRTRLYVFVKTQMTWPERLNASAREVYALQGHVTAGV